MATAPSEWALGVAEEVWGSRLAQPPWHAWAEGQPLRLQQMTPPTDDPDPTAIAYEGLRRTASQPGRSHFGAGRPGRQVTTAVLGWVCERLTSEGQQARLLVWDHARWPRRQEGRDGIQAHHRQAKRAGGVRLVVCQLPIQSPGLTRIEPYWSPAKRAVAEPGCLLSKAELIRRSCASVNGQYVEPLQQGIAKKVA